MHRFPLNKITAILFMCVLSNNAFALTCERTSHSTMGFKHAGAFNSWHPKELFFGDQELIKFSEAGVGSKAMVFVQEVFYRKTGALSIKYRLLPNGKLIAKLENPATYQQTGHVNYKCDKNSNEVRQFVAVGHSKNIDAELEKAKRMFKGHKEHALCHLATWVYKNQLEFWPTKDFDRKYPQGVYASLLAQHVGYGCNVGIPDKDLIICHKAVRSDSSASSLEWVDKNYDYYADKDLAQQLRKSVNRAKDMGLKCLTQTTADKKPTTSSTSAPSSKLDKAKSTCTELGFTSGTEKHGECVLKMMDN